MRIYTQHKYVHKDHALKIKENKNNKGSKEKVLPDKPVEVRVDQTDTC